MDEAKTYLDDVSAAAAASPRGRDAASPPAAVPGDRLVGRVFNNRFRIQSLLARGGMGKVYRAVQVPLGRPVALKVLHTTFTAAQNEDFHRRFYLEAAIAAQLTHPNTVTVFDFGKTDDGIYYLAMEYLQGRCLRQALQAETFFPAHRALKVAAQVVSAVREAHDLGAIHRDLKPANIYLLERNGLQDFVKVLDFGLVKSVAANDEGSRLTQPGKFLGSPGYMAPEQIRGRPLDGRCDIYAIGVMLYEMLAGRPPFCRRNVFETMAAHVHDNLLPLAVAQPKNPIPPQLDQLVQRCLQKDVADRFASTQELQEAIAALLGGDSPVTLVSAAPQPQRLPARLADEERSGWSVVCSRGLLASQHIDQPALAAFTRLGRAAAVTAGSAADEAATLLGPTLAMSVAAPPSRASPPRAAPQRPRRRAGAAVLAGLVGVAALMACLVAPRLPRWLPASPARRVVLRSTPSGAQAWLQDELICAATPCDVELPAGTAASRAYVVRFSLPGYAEHVTSQLPRQGTLRVEAHLDPALPPLEQLPSPQ